MGKKPKKGGPVVDDWENDVEEMQKEADGGDAPPQEKEPGFYDFRIFGFSNFCKNLARLQHRPLLMI